MTMLQETLRGMPSGAAYELFVDDGVTCTEGESPNDGSRPSCGILGLTGHRRAEAELELSEPGGDSAVAAEGEAMWF